MVNRRTAREAAQAKLDLAYDKLEQHAPDRLARAIRWLRNPKGRAVRLPLGIAPMSAGSTSVAGARPVTMPAQPLAVRGNTSVSLSAPITVNAPPGMDAREIAALIESRLRALVRETNRSPAAAMYD